MNFPGFQLFAQEGGEGGIQETQTTSKNPDRQLLTSGHPKPGHFVSFAPWKPGKLEARTTSKFYLGEGVTRTNTVSHLKSKTTSAQAADNTCNLRASTTKFMPFNLSTGLMTHHQQIRDRLELFKCDEILEHSLLRQLQDAASGL